MSVLPPPPSMLNDQSWNIFCLLNEHDINYYFMHVTECHEAFFYQLEVTSFNFITSSFLSFPIVFNSINFCVFIPYHSLDNYVRMRS